MSRLSLVDRERAPLTARPLYAHGDPGSIVKSLAHVPELLAAAMPFIGAVFGPSAVDRRLKEIVVLRMSAVMGCSFCVQTHTAVALDAGLTRDEVVALRGEGAAGDAFTDPGERALVAYTEALAEAGPIADELATAVAEHVDEPARVELTVLAGATLMLNRYCTAFELPASAATVARLEREGLA